MTGLETSFMCTGPIDFGTFTAPIKYHTEYLIWQTTNFVIYILAIYSNKEVIITLTFIIMKIIGCMIGLSMIIVRVKRGIQGI